ncbi:hypothetical protein [Niastella populi]|uniref:Uncharacterized protein n=1 Tax=Niastella populi TaxID=550983 RepID=A0A1V9GCI8_9BACT|nr:hypothetical protein [Niastella populi]OQP68401.1 hypothetical protein A4R26_00915 [Niastella populi]
MGIAIRPVVIPDDLQGLQQCTEMDAESLIAFHENIANGSFMQPMLVWDGEQPLFEVDICQAIFDDPGTCDPLGTDDYTLRFQFSPHAPMNVIHEGLYNCMEYVFLQKKASRILIVVESGNKILLDWVKDADFAKALGLVADPKYPLFIFTKGTK